MSEATATPEAPEAQAAPEASTETTVEATPDTLVEGSDTEVTYANGKYKSVSELEKGYAELQSTFSKKLGAFTGAPEEGYTLAEGVESSPRLEALQEWGKENQLSNEALNSIIEMDRETTAKAQEAYIAEQKEALGKDADIRLQNIADWAKAQVGEEYTDTFNAMITSAKGVELMEALMKNSQGQAPTTEPSKPTYTKDDLNAMRFAIDKNSGQRKMSVDPAYRAKVEALEREFFERGA
jgi:hypothetical protein